MIKTSMRIITIALLMLLSTTAWAEQIIKITQTGTGTVGISVSAGTLTGPNEDGEYTLTGGGGATVTLTTAPGTGYTVSSVRAEETLRATTRQGEQLLGSVHVFNSGSNYTFTMPDEPYGVSVTVTMVKELEGSGTFETPYLIKSSDDYGLFVSKVNSAEGASGYYKLQTDISGSEEMVVPFSGTLEGDVKEDGSLYKISGLDHALFNTIKGGTVKNIILEDVNISSGTNVGAIANEVAGTVDNIASIYNCGILSGSISGSGCVGGIVGLLGSSSESSERYARVINCYSFANVSGGSDVGGIVGKNTYASTAADIRTMVMNCIFYGDITSGTNVSPVFGGENISNLHGGLNTFNYYAYDNLKTKTITDKKYNCALGVQDKYLNRFEFYRQLLNSNHRLAAYYATGDQSNANQMAKWVLETADRSIDSPKPYPVLKARGKYASIINYDVVNAPDSSFVGRNHGGKLNKTLSVTINGVGNAPSGAGLTKSSLTLTRTDKDFDRFNFNYDKVQLPYYNEVGTGNYTGNKVVTGWKIVAIDGGTPGIYKEGDEWGGFNFADRKCTDKDLFSKSGRIFSQGAYFDVPYGVTGITIEPYWGTAAYIADEYLDVVCNTSYGAQNVTQLGKHFSSGNISINGSTQNVYTTISSALNALSGSTVYDNAVVLVGNLHLSVSPSTGTKPFTIMSADLDNDNEPDYSLILNHNGRDNGTVSPIRFDFLNVPGTAMAQKPNGATTFRNVSIYKPKGWFEVTNTCNIYFVQFEYDNGGKSLSPLILLGGMYDQFVSTQKSNPDHNTSYIHIGGSAWFMEFGNGTHSDGSSFTPHIPISVTGGDFDTFYLSGTYKPDAAVKADNAECYISSGRFGEVAGAAQQQINGNVQWQIYNADITDFFGGGVNAEKPVKGDITIDITNSYVDIYSGGPKFGDMAAGKKVTTRATGCTFTSYFGAGYGGISYNRVRTQDATSYNFTNWQKNYTDNRGKYLSGNKGVATDFDYEFFVWSTGATGARFYVKYSSLSMAKTNDVFSTLTGCIVNHNFYGGGSLGRVDGTATSVLDDCTVEGNVFGGGYSATDPKVNLRTAGFDVVPKIDTNAGVFDMGSMSATEEYTLIPGTLVNNQSAINTIDKTIVTDVDLTTLGQVTTANLTIQGNTVVKGQVFNADGTVREQTGGVFGGGDMSDVNGDARVDVTNTADDGLWNVFGGGNTANVDGTTEVNVTGGKVVRDVYGGGKGLTTVVGGDVTVNIGSKDGEGILSGTGTVGGDVYGGSALGTVNEAVVNIYSGTVSGNVFGGGLGQTSPAAIAAQNLGNATVTLEGGIVGTAVYGGANVNGVLKKDATVKLLGGTVGTAPGENESIKDVVFGGGKGEPTLVEGNVTVNIGNKTGDATPDYSGNATLHGHVYGGSALGNTNASRPESTLVFDDTKQTTVNLYGGTINGDAYGGGLGQKYGVNGATSDILSYVGGDVNVLLDGAKVQQIFGANNLNGTPKGHVKVWVKQTVNFDNEKNILKNDDTKAQALVDRTTYDVSAVYGGGNQADYNPTKATGTDEEKKEAYAEVLIEGCGKTSIEYVYGGGNAAAVPATEVTIKGAYIIDKLFGGGNGAGNDNPGADVGIIDKTAYAADPATGIYGTGTAVTKLIGGQIHEVYGGSNTLGNIRGGTTLERKDNTGDCELKIGELYGAGQLAPMDGDVNLVLECMPESFVDAVYGGAKNAEINGNVSLTVTSGKFGRVFGGNNEGGSINGSITVNVYEEGCEPLIIGELYGGGYKAPYSIFGCTQSGGTWTANKSGTLYFDQEENERAAINVNVFSCTSIGKVFGGGYEAPVIGNTHVWINTMKGTVDGTLQPSIGRIGQVFGGGNAASVTGNTTVDIGTATVYGYNSETPAEDIGVNIVSGTDYLNPETDTRISITAGIYGGGYSADVDGNTMLNIGTVNQTIDGNPSITIDGNIYGGGYGETTHVTGSVAVNIGSRTPGSEGNPDTYAGNAVITGDIYGGSALGSVNSSDNTNANDGAMTSVTLNTATIDGSIYGGGLGRLASEDEVAVAANVYGPVTVTVNNGTVSASVYGCNNENGSPKDAVNVSIAGGTITGNVYGGGNLAAYNGGDVLTVAMSGGSATDVFGGGLGTSATVTGSTVVNVSGGTVSNNIYGGGSQADLAGSAGVTVSGGSAKTIYGGGSVANVSDNTTVSITGGTLSGTEFGSVTGAVFGGGYGETTRVGGSVTVNIGSTTDTTVHNGETDVDETTTTYGGSARITGDVYGGSAKGRVNTTNGEGVSTGNPTTHVNLYGGTIFGSLYGGGLGEDNEGTESDYEAHVYGAVVVTTAGGQVDNVFGCNNILGAPQSTVAVNINGGTVTNSVYGGGNQASYLYADGSHPLQVNISGGTMDNVFGGGLSAEVAGGIKVTVSGGTVTNDVYGGGALANTNTANWDTEGSAFQYVDITSELTVGATSVAGYYTKAGDNYTLITSGIATEGQTYYKKAVAGSWAAGKNDENTGTVHKTNVILNGGTIGNAYGGGLGNATTAANVYGDITVTVNNPDELKATGGTGIGFSHRTERVDFGEGDNRKEYIIPITGRVFGCNNINGTPTGSVRVSVYSTRQTDENGKVISIVEHSPNSTNDRYEIQGVYGGGNLSDYLPADGKDTRVYVGECDVTSIEKVYGGGNSASVPSSEVTINGSYDIGYAFGGGNGGDLVKRDDTWYENDGAIVIGLANIMPIGGKIGQVFGGSDAKGLCGQVNIDKSLTNADCPLKLTRLYGAGNEADVNNVNIIISGCSGGTNSEIEYVYGGSYNAHVAHDVNLTITAGIFKNIYGGNDRTGSIGGNITVNIEETDNCMPLKIQNLFGGGYQAAYPGTRRDGTEITTPGVITVNVKSATRIDNIYGGSFKADVNGDTEVNINMTKGWWAGNSYNGEEIADAVGTIGNVYGGGNQGVVRGNATVNIGTQTSVGFVTEPVNLRANPETALTKNADTRLYDVPVLGVNISGDVFGGGNESNVNGNTTVNICTADYSDTKGFEGVSINNGSVYGGGYKGDVLGNTNVTMSGGYVFNGIFGGGYSGSVGTFERSTEEEVVSVYGHTPHDGCIGKPISCQDGTGKCTVVVDGGQIGPVTVATLGMNRKNDEGGPVPEGWVWGGGRGEVEDPATHPDTHFTAYVNETDVTIGGTAFILESIIGGGEFGRVLGNTLVKILDDCQIGVGEGQTETVNGVLKPKRYTNDQFVDPLTTAITDGNALAECSHFPYGRDTNGDGIKDEFLPYDPYYYKYPTAHIGTASTDNPSDGHTWIGCVWGGGSGYMPYEKADGTGYDWMRSAGFVEGNTEVLITGGHILANVYGGNEYTDVGGKSVITMSGGTVGVPRTVQQMKDHPVTCDIFGGGKGDQRVHFNTWTNVKEAEVNITGGIVYGSVFGGGEDGHVLKDAKVNIRGDAKIGTTGTSYADGNVFGGGRGLSGEALTAGSIGGNVEVNIDGGTVLGSVYGGGGLASVGIDFTSTDDPSYGQLVDETGVPGAPTYGHVTVNITGGTIGKNYDGSIEGAGHSGNVFGGSMGRNTLLNGQVNPLWPKLGVVKVSDVNISGGTIMRDVYGGSEFAIVRNRATVNISDNALINGNVYGGGYGSDDHATRTVITAGGYSDISSIYYTFTPMVWNGCVSGNTFVNISGGQVKKNVYGGGYLASVGLINFNSDAEGNYNYVIKHEDATNSFALSWPYEHQYIAAAPNDAAAVGGGEDAVGGKATVTIKGGRIGDPSDETSGYVFGGSKGAVFERYTEAACGNVRETEVNVNYQTTPSITNAASAADYFNSSSNEGIQGAVYGGGEDGHVCEDSKVNIIGGIIGMSVYGGGKGINTYKAKLRDVETGNLKAEEDVNSWTAGKVYGNATVTMQGGYVVRNVFGGGYYASVGKGNYSIGAGDYFKAGFGETISDNLRDGSNANSQTFLNSGLTTVTVIAGTVGTPDGIYDGNATGQIYGGSRGTASRDLDAVLLTNHPRYEYTPDFYLGFANETRVTIGDAYHAPTIYGSVYGGGRDGMVRRHTQVTINNGTIGLPYDANDVFVRDRGNVYGAGSGLSTWDETHHGTSSGTIVGNTTVTINGGTIHQSVYGGGAMASVGLPFTGDDDASKELPLCKVTINGGIIGIRDEHLNFGYGGNVFGSSRGGDFAAGESPDDLATTILTQVNMNGGTVNGDVYGGGEAGRVKKDTEVNLKGGVIEDDAYGGGKGTTAIAADVGGNTTVELNNNNNGGDADGSKKGCVVNRIFGCNDLNGTPKGHVKVYVYATQDRNEADMKTKTALPSNIEELGAYTYDVQAVYGGGNLAAYEPTVSSTEYAEVKIFGCDLTSIKQVYGGGNAAPVPATDVRVDACYIIYELFGGGNGLDNYVKDGKWYENPGANVGYHALSYYKTEGEDGYNPETHGAGTEEVPYKAITYPNAAEKDDREANYSYGKGEASTIVVGGHVYTVYGGSNKKGNIRAVAQSQYQESGTCPLVINHSYGGSKDAEIDAEIRQKLDCITDGGIFYGGSMNANINNNVTIDITNGTFAKVFGGNNKAGTINGSVTVNIEESGCTPIIIGELYGGGYLAPYSVYGYQKDEAGNYVEVDAKDEDGTLLKDDNGNQIKQRVPAKPGDTGALDTPYRDPQINIVSATSIGSIYGGGYKAQVIGSPHINVNMQQGVITSNYANYPGGSIKDEFTVGEHTDANGNKYVVESHEAASEAKLAIGTIGNIYGGGNMADIIGNTYVEIGTGQWLNENGVLETKGIDGKTYTYNTTGGQWEYDESGTNIRYDGDGSPTPARNAANITGSVYGGGNQADVTANTYVTMANGYVFDGVYGGGFQGSVGTVTARVALPSDHPSHADCVGGKPEEFAENTGKCTVVVSGGQVGPTEVAGHYDATTGKVLTDGGMKNSGRYFKDEGDSTSPVDVGFVFGAGRGEMLDPATDPDADFRVYVKETDVTISGDAFIMASVYGGGENGRVRGNTKVTIAGGQIGCGEGMVDSNNKPKRYADEQFVDPTTTTVTEDNALKECATWDYEDPYVPYDPLAGANDTDASTTATDGHTYYGCVFGGGSGYYPYEKSDGTHDWLHSAGWVGGNTEVVITGGHILTSVYGGNETTDVEGKCVVKMSGGTIGVPRTVSQITSLPVTSNLFGAGKGDQRVRFNQWTNVGSTEVEVSGGIIYGSVFGGGEDGHVLGNSEVTIKDGATIGTWGYSSFDGNVFGGGRGFSGEALTAGNVAGTVTMAISGGSILGSVYGGGRLASVGYGLFRETDEDYGKMIPDGKKQVFNDDGTTTLVDDENRKNGHVDITISGGTIGNDHEYSYDADNTLMHTIGGNVFAGGMGRLYKLDNITPLPQWSDLGSVKSTKLTIAGGSIKSNVYGGGEIGFVKGSHKAGDSELSTEITVSGGTIGTEIKESVTDGEEPKEEIRYTFGSVFGGGRGSTVEILTGVADAVNNPSYIAGQVSDSTRVNMTEGAVKASVYGGGEVGNVLGSTSVTVSGGTIGLPHFGSPTMGNVYGGGSGDRTITRCGQVFKHTNVNIVGGTINHNVYGGGSYGSVGDYTYVLAMEEQFGTTKVQAVESVADGTGTATVTITGGTIGVDGNNNGMVFGSGRGDVSAPTALDLRDDFEAWVSNTNVTIGTEGQGIAEPQIKGSVYGSGENGHTFNDTKVNIHGGTIGVADEDDDANNPNRGNVFGGGSGTDTYTDNGVEKYNPLAGIVYGNATVNIDGGFIVHNVYGAGSMGSVGRVLVNKIADPNAATKQVPDTAYTYKHVDEENGFAISWPYEFKFADGGGKATINITGGHIGTTVADGGDVYGSARGKAANRYVSAHLARVKEAEVNIDYQTTAAVADMDDPEVGCITGAVHGSGEDGYVYGDTRVTLARGLIGHSLYGGGKGIGTYKLTLGKIVGSGTYTTDVYSPIAGKVFGNTYVTMSGGHVVRNVYGGGNIASVGKGNYAGGADDYTTGGYGETLTGNLWTSTYDPENAGTVKDNAWHFLNSGKTNVVVTGGTVGYIDGTNPENSFREGLPYGNVFGGSRGEASPSLPEDFVPRYLYCPSFFSGYVNETDVTIGTLGQSNEDAGQDGKAPLILGSVYGGGQDGHVRRWTHVEVNSGEIGLKFDEDNKTLLGTDPDASQWLYRGNVFGAGSGISEYKFDFDGNGEVEENKEVTIGGRNYAEIGHSTSAGSVTHFTQVDIKGGTIYRNVVGGGSLASVGPSKIAQADYAYRKGDTAEGHSGLGKQTLNQVNIGGGTADGNVVTAIIGEAGGVAAGYGGNVFGGSRGDETLGSGFATSVWTQVNVFSGAHILGNVFGGGNAGEVMKDSEVIIGEKNDN